MSVLGGWVRQHKDGIPEKEVRLKHMKNVWPRFREGITCLRQERWSDRTGALVFNFFLTCVFVFALIEASSYPRRALAYPAIVAVLGIIATVASLFVKVYSLGDSSKQEDESAAKLYQVDLPGDQSKPPRIVYARAARLMAWLIGYNIAGFLFGLMLATAALFVIYLRVVGKARWWVIAVVTIVTVYTVFGVIANAFGVDWPAGIFNIFTGPLPVPWTGLR